jgi:hypothetical protein
MGPYVQTISDADDTMLAFSVTTRRKRFRPTFEIPYGMTWRARRRRRKSAGERHEPSHRVTLGKRGSARAGRRDTQLTPRHDDSPIELSVAKPNTIIDTTSSIASPKAGHRSRQKRAPNDYVARKPVLGPPPYTHNTRC